MNTSVRLALRSELDAFGIAAIDDQIAARGVAGCRARHKDDRAGDLFGRAQAAHRHLRHGGLVEIRHAAFDRVPVAGLVFDRPGGHRVDADSLARKRLRQLRTIGDKRCLQGVEGLRTEEVFNRSGGRHQNNRTRARLFKRGGEHFNRANPAQDVQIQAALPILRRALAR